MTRKNDPTALLPFPPQGATQGATPGVRPDARTGAPVDRDPRLDRNPGPEPASGRQCRTTSRTGLVQLDQLDLTELVRHHATRCAALRGRPLPAAYAKGERNDAGDRQTPSRRSRWTVGRTATRGSMAHPHGAGRRRGGSGAETEVHDAASRSAATARAVPKGNLDFYLDLIGAVTIMALVLLAAILVV